MKPTHGIEAGLRARLTQLTRRVGTIAGDLRAGHDDDWAERATERENDDVLERLDDITRDEVTAIRHALDRIGTGQYGVCETCQQPIGAARLRAVPTATRCVDCSGRRGTRTGS